MRRLLQQLFDALQRGHRFVTHDVWRIGRPGEEIPHGFIIKHIRVTILLVQGLVRDDLLLRASALTFATILAIVPFLAIMFFVIETFNVGEGIAEMVAPLTGADSQGAVSDADQKNRELWDQLLGLTFLGKFEHDSEIGMNQNVAKIVRDYAERSSNPRTLTLAGVLFVIATVFGLMMNIESSFNTIWGVRRIRSWYRMFSDYLIVLLLIPFLGAGVLSITAMLESSAISQRLGSFTFGLQGIQYAISWLAFAALYFVVPNTRVKARYALFAGVVAGTMWCLLSLAYVKFQFGLPRYGIVYSISAQVPVLLMWIYCSWLILLFGAEIAFAYQNEKTFAMERLVEGATYAYREAVGIWAMIEMCKRFDAGLPGLGAEDAAQAWNVPSRLLNETLGQLEEAHLVVRSASKPATYQPARSVDKITVTDIITCLRESGRDPSALRLDGAFQEMLDKVKAYPGGIEACTFADLVRERPGAGGLPNGSALVN